jgi:hypothetical protein
MRVRPLQILGQVALYAAFVLLLGYFATLPVYTHMDPQAAAITLSFGHAGQRKIPCRRLTPEEIAALPPNMRRPMDCPRERVPLLVELLVDGEPLYRDWLPPSGIAGDGTATAYQRFVVPPGRHLLTARLRDSGREEGFDYEHEQTVELAAGQNLVIDFRANTGGFRLL